MHVLRTITIPNACDGAPCEVPVRYAGSDQFAARLRKVAKERAKWAKRAHISCYRVYDADLPDFAVAIDVYLGAGPSAGQRFAVIAEYQAPATIDSQLARARFEDACAIAPVVLGIPSGHVFIKQRRREKGGGQYTHEQHESHIAYTTEADASGTREYQVELDFSGYLDTGIFLDHRTTRQMIGDMAHGTRFLNLFAYTGVATLHAAGGRAASTTTVDLSKTYLERALRNMKANGFSGEDHRLVRADCTEWVLREARTDHRYDLVFCDPPTFSNSKAMGARTWDVQRDHVRLLAAVAQLLAPEATIVFSCNLRGFKLDDAGLARAGLVATDISERTIPHDFERNPRIHRCYLVRKSG